MSKDYYNVLGVDKKATKEEIKKAYYKLAHKHHPHKGGDETKMKEVNEAYGVLSNDQKRQQYDQFGPGFEQAGFGGGQSGGFGGFADAFRQSQAQGRGSYNFNASDIGDIFGDFFGGGGGRQSTRQAQGYDIESEITIDFKEAVFGTEKTLRVSKDVVCQHCKGNGGEPGTKVTTCSTCSGTGQVVRDIGFGIGFPSTCPQCQGEGSKVEKKCSQCKGSGIVQDSENIKIKIPAGIDNGQTIKLRGKGSAGQKGAVAGDLYLRINVISKSGFVRMGYDIKTKLEISFTQAALGDKIDIDTIEGRVKLKIPEGTQSGKVFMVKGKGVPHINSNRRGDQLVEVIVKTPTKLSRDQKKTLESLGI